jgi:hypothetical protein
MFQELELFPSSNETVKRGLPRWIQRLTVALSIGHIRVGSFPHFYLKMEADPVPEMFCSLSFLEYQMMDKVQKISTCIKTFLHFSEKQSSSNYKPSNADIWKPGLANLPVCHSN